MRNNYAHDKRLLDFGSAKGKLEPALVKLVTGAFARAHSLTRKLSFQSDVYEASNPEIGFSQVGDDFVMLIKRTAMLASESYYDKGTTEPTLLVGGLN